MRAILVLLAIVWLALLPPLFTGGACSAEFDQANQWLETNRRALSTPDLASQLLQTRGAKVVVTTAAQCRVSKPRQVRQCDFGTLVRADLPVQDQICKLYRDDSVKITLHYDDKARLARIATDMAPYKSLPLPGGHLIHWAR